MTSNVGLEGTLRRASSSRRTLGAGRLPALRHCQAASASTARQRSTSQTVPRQRCTVSAVIISLPAELDLLRILDPDFLFLKISSDPMQPQVRGRNYLKTNRVKIAIKQSTPLFQRHNCRFSSRHAAALRLAAAHAARARRICIGHERADAVTAGLGSGHRPRRARRLRPACSSRAAAEGRAARPAWARARLPGSKNRVKCAVQVVDGRGRSRVVDRGPIPQKREVGHPPAFACDRRKSLVDNGAGLASYHTIIVLTALPAHSLILMTFMCERACLSEVRRRTAGARPASRSRVVHCCSSPEQSSGLPVAPRAPRQRSM